MAKEETDILNRWLLKWARWGVMFRNNVGAAWAGVPAPYIRIKQLDDAGEKYIVLKNPYRINFGLMKGSADYIGWKTTVVTPDMVGKKVAIFASVEGKTKDGQLEDDQKIWLMNVRRAGGIAFVVRDPETKPSEWESFE